MLIEQIFKEMGSVHITARITPLLQGTEYKSKFMLLSTELIKQPTSQEAPESSLLCITHEDFKIKIIDTNWKRTHEMPKII